ncbi:Cof-type HAD-IIB family hydrolase [Kingella negevensis]|uniref:Cof-type HAD-IIB family hydrolase n=1 Tax=Kingella negevensis TaxID=1522312 RepID=UPI0025513955|nr:Cof-type HAD-IIB family hydrolase [Kingella negevensis]MDK4681267.1 Cof-type HAD-IIB family hydrolase [Kingella negevensis]MDK4683464.1 Cof-type HAD-IIB family hydrolase [Kingella negevensis]MDK4691401.1 Cof-type HAD-IIB family hydrolase [Kingella negevensis]MDK4693450.1 Cof-type HAD-IIB family hydrolase [Kingella negevensis]MDK4700063.1 Cof-type HAD-IIB family hydrolase [Kingella negevensis]
MTQKPKVVFFDIDETLYINRGKKYVPESTKIALKELKKQGIITAIATGRAIPSIPEKILEVIDECGIEMIVSVNGQYVEFQGKPLATFPIDKTVLRQFSGSLKERGIAHILAGREGLFAFAENDYLRDALNSLGIVHQTDADALDKYETYQILGFYPQEQDAEVAQLLPENFQTIRWHASGLDLLDKDGSKARGIQAALDKLGLTMADAMAFGDGPNDFEMIEAVGFGVAMDNAIPELKAVANHVCPTIDDDGIYRGLVELGVIEDVLK